jgi:hypothetical protein
MRRMKEDIILGFFGFFEIVENLEKPRDNV